MPFEFCIKHSHRWEKGHNVCVGCHDAALDNARNAQPANSHAQVTHIPESVTHDVTHSASNVAHITHAERQRRWRETKGDEYRAKNRERMRRKRA